jgi:hypothetical protein
MSPWPCEASTTIAAPLFLNGHYWDSGDHLIANPKTLDKNALHYDKTPEFNIFEENGVADISSLLPTSQALVH